MLNQKKKKKMRKAEGNNIHHKPLICIPTLIVFISTYLLGITAVILRYQMNCNYLICLVLLSIAGYS